jgi:hypothetical protein
MGLAPEPPADRAARELGADEAVDSVGASVSPGPMLLLVGWR